MKKIFMSILAIALTIGAVSGTAYALFSDTASVAGISISSGNANLEIYDGGTTTPIANLISALNGALKNLYPGFTDYTTIKLANESTSNIGLDLKVQLTNVGGDWSSLYNQVQLAIVPKGEHNNVNPPEDAHFADLNHWSDAARAFGTTVDYNTFAEYNVFIKVKSAAGNEIAQKALSGNLVFTGTQAK